MQLPLALHVLKSQRQRFEPEPNIAFSGLAAATNQSAVIFGLFCWIGQHVHRQSKLCCKFDDQVLVFKRRCAHSSDHAGIRRLRECRNSAFNVSGLLNIDWRRPYVERAATPSSLSISAFCTCSRFSASSIATQLGASRTASAASTLRRTGRQWLKIALLVMAIFPSSTMKRT